MSDGKCKRCVGSGVVHYGRSSFCPDCNGSGISAEPSPEPETPVVPDEFVFEQEANMMERELRFYVARLHGHCTALREKLKKTEARVAILDAQKVKLPEWEPNERAAEEWWNRIKDHKGGSVGAKSWYQCALSRERQLLDALRAVQAWREVAQRFRGADPVVDCSPACTPEDCPFKAYDVLAGKEGA